jgi:hypothetical protein
LALFGRRPLQHAHTLVMAATENLHRKRHVRRSKTACYSMTSSARGKVLSLR